MKIVNKVLISIDESDLKDGEFYNKSIVEVADECFNDMPSLKHSSATSTIDLL